MLSFLFCQAKQCLIFKETRYPRYLLKIMVILCRRTRCWAKTVLLRWRMGKLQDLWLKSGSGKPSVWTWSHFLNRWIDIPANMIWNVSILDESKYHSENGEHFECNWQRVLSLLQVNVKITKIFWIVPFALTRCVYAESLTFSKTL